MDFKQTKQLILERLKRPLFKVIFDIIVDILILSLLYYFTHLLKYGSRFPYIMISYIIYGFIRMLFKYKKSRNIIRYVIPVIHTLMSLFIPIMQFFIYLILVFFPYFIIWAILKHIFPIDIEIAIYTTLSLGSIFILMLADKILRFLNEKLCSNEKREGRKEKQQALLSSLINKGNIQLLLYTLYLVSIICSSIIGFSHIKSSFSKSLMTPILQSFATILAFERVISKKSIININDVWKSYIQLIANFWHIDKESKG